MHSNQTTTEMTMTPAHNGNAPSETAVQQEAPAIALMAAQPTFETKMKMTQRQLPQ